MAPIVPYDTQIILVLTEGNGPSPGENALGTTARKLPFPSRTEVGKPRMRARRNDDSDIGDLVDPSLGGSDAHHGPTSHPNPSSHGPVFTGGGEREARAYVGPTNLPAAPAVKADASKVAISSSVDPRRMQTMRLAPGRPRPGPDERPDGIIEDAIAPSSRMPHSGVHSSQRPPKSAGLATMVMRPAPPTASSGPPVIVWVLAVALAALIGAGTALWLRRGNAPAPAPAAPTTAPAPR